jgi:hypothetical protein
MGDVCISVCMRLLAYACLWVQMMAILTVKLSVSMLCPVAFLNYVVCDCMLHICTTSFVQFQNCLCIIPTIIGFSTVIFFSQKGVQKDQV